MTKQQKNSGIPTSRGWRRGILVLLRPALWTTVVTLAAATVWATWAIAMSGGGRAFALCVLTLAAPWPLFYAASRWPRRPHPDRHRHPHSSMYAVTPPTFKGSQAPEARDA